VPEYEVTGIWRTDRPTTDFKIRTGEEIELGSTFESTVKDGMSRNIVWLVFDRDGDTNRLYCVPWMPEITTTRPLEAETL
jgi:hypothetical protein